MKGIYGAGFARIVLPALLILTGCGKEESPSEFSNIVSVSGILDVGNALNGSDLMLDMSVSDNSLTEFWIIVNKADNILNVAAINSLETSQKGTVEGASGFQRVSASLTTDADGDPIGNDRLYSIQVFTPENQKVTEASEQFTLSGLGALSGDYRGTWNDSFYSNFAVSMELAGGATSYSGRFYYSRNFTSCCGGADDGNINFTLEEGNLVSNFSYNQFISGFTGVNGTRYEDCPGLYTGEGTLEDELTIVISFEGTDCEGDHENGTLRFTRIN